MYSFQSKKFGFQRHDCDNEFYIDMIHICRTGTDLPAGRGDCMKTARKWAKLAVRLFGFLFFIMNPPQWCGRPCVQRYMPE